MNRSAQLPSALGFRVSPRTLQMLGRENISSPIIAVTELVKNAYDADATEVQVTFESASRQNGRIIIADNGSGMDLDDLINKWMVISTDNKVSSQVTAGGRTKVGEKGIGRLAMDRLGKRTTIRTHPMIHNGVGYRLFIDWTKYEKTAGQLHEITHPLAQTSIRPDEHSGTTIEILDLRDRWNRADYQRLYHDLSLLVPPFGDEIAGFSLYFQCDEAPDLSGKIESPMAAVAEFILQSELTEDGQMLHKLTHRSGHVRTEARSWSDAFRDLPPDARPSCGSLTFVLYFYPREVSYLRDLSIRNNELSIFLNRFQGVRIYRDNFRVKPYGDPGADKDWLGLNARRVRNPAGIASGLWVVAENQVVGSIFITRAQNPYLQDRTNREGLIENSAYHDMRRFALHAIRFLELERHALFLQAETARLERPPSSVSQGFDEIKGDLDSIISDLNELTASPRLRSDEESFAKANILLGRIGDVSNRLEQTRTIYAERQSEQELIIGLATLGIAMTAFGHETTRAVTSLLNRAKFVMDFLNRLPDDLASRARMDMEALTKAATLVEQWGNFALDRIRRDKRTRRDLDLNKLITEIIGNFEGVIRAQSISVKENLHTDVPKIRAFAMDFEAILINLFTNSVESMRYKSLDNRIIEIESSYDDNTSTILLRFADSGSGISEKDRSRIFDPLFTTRLDKDGEPTGTGMGLTIIKNVVDSYNGQIKVEGRSNLGGAEFCLMFPVRRGRGDENGRS